MITTVIPSFQRRECVLALLESLRRQAGDAPEIIVVDDASRDGTPDAVAAAYPDVKLLRNDVNRGPAASRNAGVRAARGDIIVGFDSDVVLRDRETLRTVELLFRTHPNVDGLAFRILGPDGTSDDRERWWHAQGIERSATAFETDYFSGTAYAFRRDRMIAAGLFPESFYMHYEEVELALRLIDLGGVIRYSPELTAVHMADPASKRSVARTFYKPRNQILLAAGLFSVPRALGFVVPRLAYGLAVAVAGGHLPVYVRALGSAARAFPQRWRSRTPLSAQTWRRVRAMHGCLGQVAGRESGSAVVRQEV